MKRLIVNLTMHPPSEEQIQAGVFEFKTEEVRNALVFEELPSLDEIYKRAQMLGNIAKESDANYALIGGAPYLMRLLESALLNRGIIPVYAFSKRENVEKVIDGKTIKTNVFKHIGFIEVLEKWRYLNMQSNEVHRDQRRNKINTIS